LSVLLVPAWTGDRALVIAGNGWGGKRSMPGGHGSAFLMAAIAGD